MRCHISSSNTTVVERQPLFWWRHHTLKPQQRGERHATATRTCSAATMLIHGLQIATHCSWSCCSGSRRPSHPSGIIGIVATTRGSGGGCPSDRGECRYEETPAPIAAAAATAAAWIPGLHYEHCRWCHHCHHHEHDDQTIITQDRIDFPSHLFASADVLCVQKILITISWPLLYHGHQKIKKSNKMLFCFLPILFYSLWPAIRLYRH